MTIMFGMTIDIGSVTLFHRRGYHDINAASRFQKIAKTIRRVVSGLPPNNNSGVNPDLQWGFGCDCLRFVCLFTCFIQVNLMLLHERPTISPAVKENFPGNAFAPCPQITQ